MEEYSSLTQNFMQTHCSTASVNLNVMATQDTRSLNWCLPPLLTSTVKSSLFRHVHSSPLSLASTLYRCCANHSHYVNNGCNFLDIPPILFCSGCHKNTTDWVVYTKMIHYLTILEARNLTLVGQYGGFMWGLCPWFADCCFLRFTWPRPPPWSHHEERCSKWALCVSSYKATHPVKTEPQSYDFILP